MSQRITPAAAAEYLNKLRAAARSYPNGMTAAGKTQFYTAAARLAVQLDGAEILLVCALVEADRLQTELEALKAAIAVSLDLPPVIQPPNPLPENQT